MIRSQVIYSRLAAIVRELAETIGRTARSPGLAEGRRFAAAAMMGNLELAAQEQYDAGQFYLIRSSVAALLEYFAFDLNEGDIVLVGDPFSGGSTPQYITIAAPVFHDGELVLFPVVRAELADLAGEYPGTLHPFATETWQESVRFTPVKLYRHGVLQRDVLRFILRNSRAEELVRSDIEALIAALRASAAALTGLLRDRGRQRVTEAVADAIAHGEKLALSRIAAYGEIDRPIEGPVQGPGGTGATIRGRVAVRNSRLVVDLAGTDAEVAAPINMTLDHARGYILAAALADLLDDVTMNDGILRSLTATAPAGSLLNTRLPSPTGLSDLVTGHALVAAIRRALGGSEQIARLDGQAPASVLFRPIGASEVNPPISLDPGFAISAQGWGAPILAGRRLLPSAEVLETRDGFMLIEREIVDGGMRAILRNARGALEGNFFVPADSAGAHAAIDLIDSGAVQRLDCAVAVGIPEGAELRFSYPSYEEQTHE